MSRKYKFRDSNKTYFISFATINRIDVFTRNEYKDELLKSWQHCQQKKGLEISAWCILPSHIHMIISSHGKPLEDIVTDMKCHTSSELKSLIKEHTQESRREWVVWMMERAGKKNSNNTDWQFWHQHNKPIEILNRQMFAEIVFYIHQHPVVSGFVYESERRVYSSAKKFQKMMASFNWRSFVKEDLLCGNRPGTRIADALIQRYTLAPIQKFGSSKRCLRQHGENL